MKRIMASIWKEILLLSRDRAGLAILFVMPVFLVMVMTLIQDMTFRKLDETRLSVLYLDLDQDSLGYYIGKGLQQEKFLNPVTKIDNKALTEELLKHEIAEGKYQIGIVVNPHASEAIRTRGRAVVEDALSQENDSAYVSLDSLARANIILYFDPVIKNSFKQTIRTVMENFTNKIEARITFETFAKEISKYLPGVKMPAFDPHGAIDLQEIYAKSERNTMIPNSVQHNIPAWAIFAMFFIVVPLTGNIIKERESGTSQRLRIMPGTYFHVLGSKIIVYLAVCLVQFILILLLGIFIIPLFGLSALHTGNHILVLMIMGFATALAATGYGVMVGTISTTFEQAASFGSVSVIILSAIGGLWVPALMQKISIISPMNWGLEGFYDIFLRGGSWSDVLPYFSLLIGFFLLCLFTALLYSKSRRNY